MGKFIRDLGQTCLKLFECPTGVDPLYFSTLCVYFYAECQIVIDQAKEQVKRDVSINSMGVGDGQQDSHPSKNTNESTQPNQPNPSKQPKSNTTGSPKKKPNLKDNTYGVCRKGYGRQPSSAYLYSCWILQIHSRYCKGSSP